MSPSPRMRDQFRPVGGSPPVPGERMGTGLVVAVVVVPEPTASPGAVVLGRVVVTVVAEATVVLGTVPTEELTVVPGTVVTVIAGPEKTAGLVVELVAVVGGLVAVVGGLVAVVVGVVVV